MGRVGKVFKEIKRFSKNKIGKRHKLTDLRNWANPKHDKLK